MESTLRMEMYSGHYWKVSISFHIVFRDTSRPLVHLERDEKHLLLAIITVPINTIYCIIYYYITLYLL